LQLVQTACFRKWGQGSAGRTNTGISCVGRLLKTAFSIFLILAGGYFLFLYLQHPTPHGALYNAVPAVFWIGLGAFLLWHDSGRSGKSPPA
jgi:hypothetical protein